MPTGTNTGPHPTVSFTYKNENVDIDELLAPLIIEIWKAGIGTWMSCQEVEVGIAWIEFDSVDDLLKFANIAISYDADVNSTYNRIEWNRKTLGMTLPEWEFRFSLMDMNYSDSDSERIFGNEVDFVATVGAYFPHEDIAPMLSRLREYNSCHSSCTVPPVDG